MSVGHAAERFFSAAVMEGENRRRNMFKAGTTTNTVGGTEKLEELAAYGSTDNGRK